MMTIYQYNKKYDYLQEMSNTLTKIVRKSTVLHVKFWDERDKQFGTDEYPDFTNERYWGNLMFEQVAGEEFETDGEKAKAWITYKEDIKYTLSAHRSTVTSKCPQSIHSCCRIVNRL